MPITENETTVGENMSGENRIRYLQEAHKKNINDYSFGVEQGKLLHKNSTDVRWEIVGTLLSIFILLLSIISCPNLLCMYSFLTYFLPLTFKYINDPSEQPWYVIAFSFDIYIGVCLSFVVSAISFIATIPDWVKLTSCWVCFALSFGQLGILVSLARLRRAEYNRALFFNLLGFPVERNIDMKLKRRQKEVRREVKFERTNSIPTHIRYLSNDPQLQNSDGRMADVIQHLTLTNSTIR